MQPDEVAPIVFLDVETTGLDRARDEIWEFASIRRDPDGEERTLHLFVEHDQNRCGGLPEPFLDDHVYRWPGDPEAIMSRLHAAMLIEQIFDAGGGPEVHLAACGPDFDAAMITRLLGAFDHPRPWHYHLIDVENMVRGYLLAHARWIEAEVRSLGPDSRRDEALAKAQRYREYVTPPWSSEEISRLLGVEPPPKGERHTALGDARWCMTMYDRMVKG